MLIRFSSVSSSILFTVLIDVNTLIVSGSFCTVVGVLVIGHSLSDNLRKSSPVCQPLLISMGIGLLPRVQQSAMSFLLSVQYQSFFSVPSWISPTRLPANVLNPYVSLCIIACTIWESTMW